jgi:hypothetical protein
MVLLFSRDEYFIIPMAFSGTQTPEMNSNVLVCRTDALSQ